MKIKHILLGILFIFVTCTSYLRGDLRTFGSYQNRFFLIIYGNSLPDTAQSRFQLGDYNRLRLQFQSTPSKKISTNLAIDFFTFHGIMSNPLGVHQTSGSSKNYLISLDRAYVDIYLPGVDITLGKQRVAFGISRLWAPLDLFNRINIFEPGEEKPGVNAIKLDIPIGKFSGLTAVFSPEKDFKSSKSGLRFQSMIKEIDIGLSLIRNGQNKQTIFGLDLRGENLIGWWIETGFFKSESGNKTKIVIGMDYTFPILGGLYWMSEFFYDQSGEKSMAHYNYDILLSGDRFTLGRKYLMSSFSAPLTPFLSGSLAYIGNWTDSSSIISPGIQYSITDNAVLQIGYFLRIGQKGGEFNPVKGADIFYAWLKTSF